MDLGGLAGLTTVALTMLLSQTRIFYAMAKDGLLPPIFAKIHSHTKTPWISIIISGTYRVLHNDYAPSSQNNRQIIIQSILYQIKARQKLHLGV